jgi:hypothetical protein
MWKTHCIIVATSITFGRCWRMMTGVPVWTIRSTLCYILRSKARMMLTLQKFSAYCPLLIYCKVYTGPICFLSKQFRTTPFCALYPSRYMIWENHISTKCVEVSLLSHLEIHQKVSEMPTLDTYSTCKLKRTRDTRKVDSYLDMIRMNSNTVYLFNSKMGCGITVNHVPTLYVLSIWDLIATYNIPMPTKGSCLKPLTSDSSICNVKRMHLITPSKDEIHLLLCYSTSAGLHRIRSSKFRMTCQLGNHYWPFLSG